MFGEFKFRFHQGKYILSPYSTQSHTGFLFQLEIRAETSGFDCYRQETGGALPDYTMHHFDEILMAGIENGLMLLRFKELD
jgi:hypothetical protein